jgi:hypothetical protein
MLEGDEARHELESLAFQPDGSFSQLDGIVAGFQLWDRIGADAGPAVQALASNDQQIADRAEWILVKAGPAVLSGVRRDLDSENPAVCARAIRIVAWQGDAGSLEQLQALKSKNGPNVDLAVWAIGKIEMLHPEVQAAGTKQ